MSKQNYEKESMLEKNLKRLEKGTLVELMITAGKLHQKTVGYFDGIESTRKQKYVLLNKYKKENDDPVDIINDTRYPLKLIKGYTTY